MDIELTAKRPCLKQTTLFVNVVVTDLDIYAKLTNDYEQFDNAFVRSEQQGRGSYSYTVQNHASHKCAADQVWQTANATEKQELFEDAKPLTSTLSSDGPGV